MLPCGSEILAVGIQPEQFRLEANPVLLAAGNPDNEMVSETFLIAGAARTMNDLECFIDQVRFIDSFARPAGRFGAVGVRTCTVYHVLHPKPLGDPIKTSLPVMATRVELWEVLPPSCLLDGQGRDARVERGGNRHV